MPAARWRGVGGGKVVGWERVETMVLVWLVWFGKRGVVGVWGWVWNGVEWSG